MGNSHGKRVKALRKRNSLPGDDATTISGGNNVLLDRSPNDLDGVSISWAACLSTVDDNVSSPTQRVSIVTPADGVAPTSPGAESVPVSSSRLLQLLHIRSHSPEINIAENRPHDLYASIELAAIPTSKSDPISIVCTSGTTSENPYSTSSQLYSPSTSLNFLAVTPAYGASLPVPLGSTLYEPMMSNTQATSPHISRDMGPVLAYGSLARDGECSRTYNSLYQQFNNQITSITISPVVTPLFGTSPVSSSNSEEIYEIDTLLTRADTMNALYLDNHISTPPRPQHRRVASLSSLRQVTVRPLSSSLQK